MTSVGSAPATEATAGPRWRNRAVEIGWCVALAVGPYLWRLMSGTRRMPNDDTWAYERIFASFYDTGRIVLIDWNDITLVGMLPVTRAWVELVGYGALQIHLLGSVMGLVSLLALRSIMRTLRPDLTLLSILILGTYSGFVVTTGTFMADQFALAGVLVSLALVIKVLTVERAGWVAGVLVVGAALAAVYGFSVRQQTAIAAAAIGVVLLGARRRLWWGWLVYGAVYASIAGPFYLWRAGLPHGGTEMTHFNAPFLVAGLVVMAVTLSLTLLPLVLAVDREQMAAPISVRVVSSIVAAVGVGFVDAETYVNDSLSVLRRVGDLPLLVRVGLAVVVVNLAISVVAAIARRRPPFGDDLGTVLVGAAGLVLLADVATVFLASDYYPRYSLFLVVMMLVAFAVSRPRVHSETKGRRLALAMVGLLGFAAYWAMDGALAPLRAGQEAAEVAACAGVPPERLDGGITWMGMHSTGVVVADYWSRPTRDDGLPVTQHERIFPEAVRDAVLLFEPPEDLDDLATTRIESGGMLPGNGIEAWLVVREDRADELARCAGESE